MEERPISNQIAIYMTSRKLCELNDRLKPAPVEYYAHLHAQGEKLANRKSSRSCIGVVLQDYSRGTGKNTVRVTANLSPEFFPYALSRAKLGMERFDFHEEKIFGEPDEQGRSRVTKLSVKRASVGSDGKIRNYPWFISIENGRAVKAKNENGGVYIKKDSYVKEHSVYVNINDYDFFRLMQQTVRYITVWELTHGSKKIREAGSRMENSRTTED